MPEKLNTMREFIREKVFARATPEDPVISSDGERQLSWIFDFRTAMGNTDFLHAYADAFWDTYEAQFPFQVCGMETAGIPLVTAIVMKGRERGKIVNGLYARKSRKKSARMRVLEGTLGPEPVIVVDDLVNTGQSLERIAVVLADAGAHVTDVCTILALRSMTDHPITKHFNGARVFSFFSSDTFGVRLLTDTPTPQYERGFSIDWKFQAPHPSLQQVIPKSAPTVDDSSVYLGSDNGVMYALDQNDGATRWTYRVGLFPFGKGIFSTPAVAKGVVFFGAYDGNCYALDAMSGERKWVYRDADWIGSSPALAPDLGLLFIGLEFGLFRKHGGIAALSMETGAEAWSMREMTDFTHCSPLYVRDARCVVIGSNDGTVYCFSAKKGTLQWTFRTEGSVKASFAYDRERKCVIFGSFDGHIYALDIRTGTPAWSFDTGEATYMTPAVDGSLAYVASLNKRVFALNLADGSVQWSFTTRGRVFASPVVAEGLVWIGSNDGRLYGFDPATGAVRSYFQTSERIVNAIAYNAATRKFFVPTQKNELYCIERTDTAPSSS